MGMVRKTMELKETVMETGEYPFRFEELDVCRIIREAVALQYGYFEENEVEIEVDIPDQSMMCRLDNLEFTRAVNNIVSNAYRHNKRGSRVKVSIDADDEKVWIKFIDDGEEISDNLKNTIFDAFVCANASRNSKGGSGLGLAITKKIVERHQGKIYIDEKCEGYTKAFVIELKRLRELSEGM